MTEQNKNIPLEREIGQILESQRNVVASMKRIEDKMDERHKEHFDFEVTVREHITVQGNYQEIVEKHEDYIDIHVKPCISETKAATSWIKDIGAPAVEDIKRVKYMVAGAAMLASTSILASWNSISNFFKRL